MEGVPIRKGQGARRRWVEPERERNAQKRRSSFERSHRFPETRAKEITLGEKIHDHTK